MTTQISFTADENLKNKALEKAKEEGITLKAVLIYSMKSFVDGKIKFGLINPEEQSDVEELTFNDQSINKKALKLANLLK